MLAENGVVGFIGFSFIALKGWKRTTGSFIFTLVRQQSRQPKIAQ